MFTTFVGVSHRESSQKGGNLAAPRPKRSQVNRACDWCRLNRVKCENSTPCHNCKRIGRQCRNDGLNKFRSLASATREVERLRAQIRGLERRLRPASNYAYQTPPVTLDEPRLPQKGMLEYYESKASTWKGVQISNEFQQQTLYYGPSSLQFFIKRMASFLATALHQSHFNIEPCYDAGAIAVQQGGLASLSIEDQLNCDYLMRLQEDYFLDLFWQRQHALYPILDEAEFRQHYESLWSDSTLNGAFRKSSPLVDIVLALCIQFGAALIPRNGTNEADAPGEKDTRLAGWIYFQRCHALLNEAGNTVSITTVQCLTLSVMYLFNAALMNNAHMHLATAVQTAYAIGLHHEPPGHLLEPQRELNRRLWWSLYILDSHLGMQLGRPWLIQLPSATCRPPSDSPDVAQPLGPNYVLSTSDMTWLSFHSQTLLLLNTVRTVHAAFFERSNEIVSRARTPDFYRDSQVREKCARFLSDCMKELNTWAQQVPNGLRIPRKGGGGVFPTDRLPLEFDFSAPLWLQRQQLILELCYHNYAVNLYRPFICFSPTSTFTPHADNNAVSCLNHAIAITDIINQEFMESDILNGMRCVFSFQDNAMFSMVGYAYAYPINPMSASARNGIATAASVFENFGHTLLPQNMPHA